MPLRSLKNLQDQKRCNVFAEAVEKAVAKIEDRLMEPRVLSLGGGSGLLPMTALKCGVKHVTVAER